MTVTCVLMGPSGCGKSTIGRLVADRWGAAFVEGDDHHPARNVEAMRAGRGLTDDERAPWIEAVGRAVVEARSPRVVLACSALSAAVRGWLTQALPGPHALVLLRVPEPVLAARLAARTGHFAGPALLASQLAALTVTQDVAVVDADDEVGVVADRVLARIAGLAASG